MLNELGGRNHWLQIRLRGVQANCDGVGAHIRGLANDLTLVREVHSGRGYQSQWGMRLHFGLECHTIADRIEVCWLWGGTQVLENVAANQLLTMVEEKR
jgi:hypothetical protein